MGFYINRTGKLFGAGLAAWVGAKLFQKYQESQDDSNGIHSLEDMDLPDSFKKAIRNAAFCGDKRTFLEVLDHYQVPHDSHIRRRLWALAGGD